MALSETLRGTRASALGFSFAARFAAAATSSGSFPRSSANALSWKRVPILVLVLLVWLVERRHRDDTAIVSRSGTCYNEQSQGGTRANTRASTDNDKLP